MPTPYCVDDFSDKFDSLYRLVIVGARRANQINKNEAHAFGGMLHGRKPTISALEEVLQGKLSWSTGDADEAAFLE